MLAKMARSAPRSRFGVPRMTAIVRAAKRSCQNAAKAQKSTTVRGSSGESRLKHRVTAPTVLRLDHLLHVDVGTAIGAGVSVCHSRDLSVP